jgi:hypothetical protein
LLMHLITPALVELISSPGGSSKMLPGANASIKRFWRAHGYVGASAFDYKCQFSGKNGDSPWNVKCF